MALLDTHYYGGVKKYQWVTLPMALHGVVVKKDGTRVNISIGEKDEDPVVGITDLFNPFIRKTDAEERECDRQKEKTLTF